MAASVVMSFAEKLTAFRQLLPDTDIDNDISAQFYSEHNMAIIRDLTICMQLTENRHVVVV